MQQLRGAHQAALASVRSALAWAAERGTSAGQGPAVLSAQLVGLLLDADDIAAARPFAEEALLALNRLAHMQLPSLLTRLAVVRLRVAEGDLPAARDLVHEARAALSPDTPVQVLIAAAEAAVRMTMGDVDAAVRWASSVDPLVLPPPLGLQTHLFAAAVEAFGTTPTQVLLGHGLATGDPAVLRAAAIRAEHLRRLGQEFGRQPTDMSDHFSGPPPAAPSPTPSSAGSGCGRWRSRVRGSHSARRRPTTTRRSTGWCAWSG